MKDFRFHSYNQCKTNAADINIVNLFQGLRYEGLETACLLDYILTLTAPSMFNVSLNRKPSDKGPSAFSFPFCSQRPVNIHLHLFSDCCKISAALQT